MHIFTLMYHDFKYYGNFSCLIVKIEFLGESLSVLYSIITSVHKMFLFLYCFMINKKIDKNR